MSIDERPPMWIGHVAIKVPDVAACKSFFVTLGMRDVFPDATEIAILELRAGTHLIVQHTDQPVESDTSTSFDLMVDDIDATHEHLTNLDLNPSALDRGKIHTTFEVNEPNGHVVKYFSSHNSGLPV